MPSRRDSTARARRLIGGLVALIGGAVLIGWFLELPALQAVMPGMTTMKANTAVGLIAGGLWAGLIGSSRAGAIAAAALIGLLGAVTLIEYGAGLSLGLDEFIVPDPLTTSRPFNGRMSPATALAFMAAGASMLLLTLSRTPRMVKAAHLLAVVPALVGLLALAGYAYGVKYLYHFGPFVSVALHTAAGLALLAAACLLTRRDESWQHRYLGRPVALAALVQISAFSLIAPFIVGLVVAWGMREDYYQAEFALALFAVLIAGVLIALAFQSATILAGAERDIAEARKAAEVSAGRLELALAGGRGIGTWDWDVVNDRSVGDLRVARYYGVDPARAAAGAPIAEFLHAIHPDDRDRVRARIDAALRSGEMFSEEYRLLRPDGEMRWVLAEGRCQKAADGTPLRFAGMSFDITDRKVAEERLRDLNLDLERRVAALALERDRTWQVSPELLGVTDREGRFETSNPAWQTLLGWSSAEVAAMRLIDLVHPEDVAHTAAAWADGIERQASGIRFENRCRSKDGGYRWLSWVGVPESGKVYTSARDVTEAKEQAEALLRVQEALRQSQKMEAVGQLTGGLAHDFNNLLGAIGGSLELIEMRVGQGRIDALDRYIAAGQSGVKRAAALTHRLLAFSRRQTLDPQSTDVNQLIAGMEELIRRTVGPAVEVEVAGAAGLWPTFVDANQLENALLNLCINARDAMPEGGRLTIETANRWLDERAAMERDLPPGQYILLAVTDTGTGMSPEIAQKAFDPFFTTKPLGQGTGLGLSMIYGFARQSGGQIRIHTQLGQGTTMSLYLPRHDHDPAGSADMARDLVPTASGTGQMVLVIDDEPTIRMLIAETLDDGGYAVMEAADGPTGLRILQTSTRVDLLITDVGLPGGLNGRQVADAARTLRPALKVLFITGYAENAVVGNGHLDRDMAIMTKPFAIEDLTTKVRDMLEG